MRFRVLRHLGTLLDHAQPSVASTVKGFTAAAWTSSAEKAVSKPPTFGSPEFTARQYAIVLLHVAAAIEHSLLVQYLYAAYSLGGPQVPADRRMDVARWQETILGIAKEEMGHLMTVQNLLRSLGGPLSVDREDFPGDDPFTPFRFTLHRLDRKTLAKYICAEAPPADKWTGKEADEIRKLAQADGKINRVGALYEELAALFKLADIPDSDFRGETFPVQMNWDEWGRGYQGGERGNTLSKAKPDCSRVFKVTPDVLVLPVTSRTAALRVIEAVATQGEALIDADPQNPSHFARFLAVFKEFPQDWEPSRPVATNPYVATLQTTLIDKNLVNDNGESVEITHEEARRWAHLFNLRYRILLTSIVHSFDYPSNLSPQSQVTPRGLLVNSTFGEMYNLRAISQILVQLPLSKNMGPTLAGPPFQMPYTMRLPHDPRDRWRFHQDFLEASAKLAVDLQARSKHKAFLQALLKIDQQTSEAIEKLVRACH